MAAGILALTSSLSIAAPDPANLHPLMTPGTDFWVATGGTKLSVGYSFHVNVPLLVNAIGSTEYDQLGRGHVFYLWDSTGDLLFTGGIGGPETDDPDYNTTAGSYKWIDFNTVLPVGDYVIAGWGYGGLTNGPNGDAVVLPLLGKGKTTSDLITITAAGYTSGPVTPSAFIRGAAGLAGGQVILSAVALASAVPEPSTYAMLFAGLAMVGGIARRRKQ